MKKFILKKHKFILLIWLCLIIPPSHSYGFDFSKWFKFNSKKLRIGNFELFVDPNHNIYTFNYIDSDGKSIPFIMDEPRQISDPSEQVIQRKEIRKLLNKKNANFSPVFTYGSFVEGILHYFSNHIIFQQNDKDASLFELPAKFRWDKLEDRPSTIRSLETSEINGRIIHLENKDGETVSYIAFRKYFFKMPNEYIFKSDVRFKISISKNKALVVVGNQEFTFHIDSSLTKKSVSDYKEKNNRIHSENIDDQFTDVKFINSEVKPTRSDKRSLGSNSEEDTENKKSLTREHRRATKDDSGLVSKNGILIFSDEVVNINTFSSKENPMSEYFIFFKNHITFQNVDGSTLSLSVPYEIKNDFKIEWSDLKKDSKILRIIDPHTSSEKSYLFTQESIYSLDWIVDFNEPEVSENWKNFEILPSEKSNHINLKIKNRVVAIRTSESMHEYFSNRFGDIKDRFVKFYPNSMDRTSKQTIKDGYSAATSTDPQNGQKPLVEEIETFTKNLSLSVLKDGWYDSQLNNVKIQNEVFSVLRKKNVSNIRILAPPGSGKSFFIDQLVRRVTMGDAPPELRDYHFISLDPSTLAAGTSLRGQMELRVEAMKKISLKEKIIWVIDEAHYLATVSGRDGDNNIWQSLKSSLGSGEMKMIILTTEAEWNEYLSSDKAIERRFKAVHLNEPNNEEIHKIILRWVEKNYSGFEPEVNVLEHIIYCAKTFGAVGSLIGKVIDLIDLSYSRLSRTGYVYRAPSIEDIDLASKELYNIDPAIMNPSENEISNIEKRLSKIIGHSELKNEIIGQTKMFMSRVADMEKPKMRIGVFGVKGTGKTEIVRTYAEARNLPFKRILMSQYNLPTHIGELKREIYSELNKNAFTIFLFDELEKAHVDVQRAFLDILDFGIFTVSLKKGTRSTRVEVSARNSSFFFAGNAGNDYIKETYLTETFSEEKFRKVIEDSRYSEYVDSYLLDRIPRIFPSVPSSKIEAKEILKLHIDNAILEIKKNSSRSIHIKNLDQFIDALVNNEKFKDISEGNRKIIDYAKSLIGKAIANEIILSKKDTAFLLDYKSEKFNIIQQPICRFLLSEF